MMPVRYYYTNVEDYKVLKGLCAPKGLIIFNFVFNLILCLHCNLTEYLSYSLERVQGMLIFMFIKT